MTRQTEISLPLNVLGQTVRPIVNWAENVARARRGMAILLGVSAMVLSLAADPAPARAEPSSTGYVAANGLQMYYEIHGAGEPVVVLHGAYMSTGMMRPVIDGLARSRKVIAVDLQAHGRTADIDRPISYEAMADDVGALMRELDIPAADIFGYSMGGGVGYQLAIRHPARVRRLVAAAAGYRLDAMYPELLEMIANMTPESFAGTPWEKAYKEVAPNPDAFPVLVKKLVDLDSRPMAWPEQDMAGFAAPTLVISGDADVIRPEHSVEIFRLRGGGGVAPYFMEPSVNELAILPGTTHLGVMERMDLVIPMTTAFLAKEIPSQ